MRGDVWWADLPIPVGSEPGIRRPVVVVSADAYNQSAIRTVLAVAITSNLRLAVHPANVSLGVGDGGLNKASVVNLTQLLTVDKARLSERVGMLDPAAMDLIDLGLRRVLGL